MRQASGKNRQRSEKKRPRSYLLPTVVGPSTCAFLRRLYPTRTADLVAADLATYRVKPGTIAKMLERESTPRLDLWIALTVVYGPEILCAVLPSPPAWLDSAQRAERQQALEAKLAALQSELDALR